LLNGAHELKIHGRYYEVGARVKEIDGLSAHADQAQLITWLKKFEKKPERIYLVHGEPDALNTLRVKIKDELDLPTKILRQDQKEFLFSVEMEVCDKGS
jgi:metallo-beta-lactamase family protein